MKPKKAILMPETLKIILAVLGILILIYLAASLYGFFVKDNKEKQAQASLEILNSKIKLVESGAQKEIKFLIESPNDWYIIAWPYQDESEKPQQCAGDYCICMCESAYSKFGVLDECNKKGICKELSKKTKTIDEDNNEKYIKIDKPISLKAYLESNQIIIEKIKKEETSSDNEDELLN